MTRAKEIGSYFDISHDDIVAARDAEIFEPFGRATYLSTCRSAIDTVLKSVLTARKVALLPGFTCHAVVKPFVNNGYWVIPYSIKDNLEIDIEDLKQRVKQYQPSVILFHDYFGFDSNKTLRGSGLIEKLQSDGIILMNDQTQSMFSSYPKINGNYFLGSIRKWMGIPDGAFLFGMGENDELEPDSELEEAKVSAMVFKHEFLFKETGTKYKVLSNYKKAEAILDSRETAFGISNISRRLFSHYDIELLKKKRIDNGSLLLSGLENNAHIDCPFTLVEDGVVPFHVPILVKQHRKELQKYLAQNNVFATVIWGCPEEFVHQISESTKRIYDEILCIPCDQRYSMEDMKYICKLIDEFDWGKEE